MRWGGSFFVRDLKISGFVAGPRLEHAELVIHDAGASEIHRIGRLPELDRKIAGTSDRSAPMGVSYLATVDGKRLLRARYPLTLVVAVYDAAGKSAKGHYELDR